MIKASRSERRSSAVRRSIHTAMVLAGLTAPTIARSQTANERAARTVAESFFTFLEREQWDSAASLVDVRRFEPFFRQQVSWARAELPQPDPTVESMMAQDSTMTRAVAEWQLAQIKRYPRPAFGDRSYQFSGVHSQQELFALTPVQAIARWLEAQDERVRMRESFRKQNCPIDVAAELIAHMPAPKQNVVAVATENDTTAFVIHVREPSTTYRDSTSLMGTEFLMVLHRKPDGWRIEPRINQTLGFGLSYGCPEPSKKKG